MGQSLIAIFISSVPLRLIWHWKRVRAVERRVKVFVFWRGRRGTADGRLSCTLQSHGKGGDCGHRVCKSTAAALRYQRLLLQLAEVWCSRCTAYLTRPVRTSVLTILTLFTIIQCVHILPAPKQKQITPLSAA